MGQVILLGDSVTTIKLRACVNNTVEAFLSLLQQRIQLQKSDRIQIKLKSSLGRVGRRRLKQAPKYSGRVFKSQESIFEALHQNFFKQDKTVFRGIW